MAQTDLFDLRYPVPTDSYDVPRDLGFLAADADGWLSRAFPCTDSTRPIGRGAGFLAWVQDLDTIEMWDGSTWRVVAVLGGGGGGGGGSSADGQWRATSVQSIGSSDTVIAFGVEETASPFVTRSTSGAGHKFALSAAGVYACSATIRLDEGNAGRRFAEWRNAAQTARHGSQGFTVDDDETATLNPCVTKYFPAGSELLVIASQSGQGSLPLVPNGGSIAPGFVRVNITRVA